MNRSIFKDSRNINGIDVYYEYYRNEQPKETIVLLHGFLSSTFSFRRLIPLLNEDFNVISVDLPPFGKSGKSYSFIYSYKNIAQTVISLLESLDISKVTVIGHSMGGQISLKIVSLRPDLAQKAILLCSSAYLKRSKLPLILSSYIPYFHLYVKLWLIRSGVRYNLQQVVYDHSLIDEEMMYGYMKPFLEEDIFKALTRMIRDREGDLHSTALKKIETPCLLIWGEHDKVVPLTVGKRLTNELKNSKLVVLKNAGHLLPEERPEEVHQHIKEFIFN
ncbi:alpha/beta fold hydrolase [Bacillus methanolicus]|uniref:Putative hydrolase YugF n=1 Tax=Bacillus methanolicus (strain MGA3 / ATCC 53907) TaxID=796606 RepID=I3DUM5_BACMM|nr:alpha/beta hydrolase [Bacillus methanolicus]AIE61174.1 putative hydrolase YugF [Bacillus methanolicus MGA3]EIJ77946.1 alpha/beta hydrolase fold protein [Bacillus methanolicus MGA3]